MLTMNKLSIAEREQYCQEIYKEYIVQTAEFLQSCDGITEILRTYIPSGCYTNFRDMLFHFRCIKNASEESAVLSQVASIIEHSNRAIRDAEVAICVRLMTILRMLIMEYSIKKEYEDELKREIERMQDCVLRLRLGSMMLEGMEHLRPSEEDFLDMIDEHLLYLDTHLQTEFQEVVEYSWNLKKRLGKQLKSLFHADGVDELRKFKAFSTYNDVVELVYGAIFG